MSKYSHKRIILWLIDIRTTQSNQARGSSISSPCCPLLPARLSQPVQSRSVGPRQQFGDQVAGLSLHRVGPLAECSLSCQLVRTFLTLTPLVYATMSPDANVRLSL
jgi:hypothetical protein